jgi:hypothetical protein
LAGSVASGVNRGLRQAHGYLSPIVGIIGGRLGLDRRIDLSLVCRLFPFAGLPFPLLE